MQARDIMTRGPTCCTADATLQDVARMMVEHDCGCIPVTEGDRVVGVVTDRDIACRIVAHGRNPLELAARDCMSSPAFTVREDDTIEHCCEVLEQHMIRRLPVVDANGKLCGMIAQADIARRTNEARAAEVVRQVSQPTPDSSRVH
jgi:CBS domain-containing protein